MTDRVAMTPQELREIEERAQKATPGPWRAESDMVVDEYGCMIADVYGPMGKNGYDADAAIVNAQLIAEFPRLLAYVRHLESALRDISSRSSEWRANKLGGVDIQRARWVKLGRIASEALTASDDGGTR